MKCFKHNHGTEPNQMGRLESIGIEIITVWIGSDIYRNREGVSNTQRQAISRKDFFLFSFFVVSLNLTGNTFLEMLWLGFPHELRTHYIMT
jgi:hypothetical protein